MQTEPRLPVAKHNQRQGAFALLTTMLLLTLLVAVTAQLVTVTSTEAVSAARRHRSLVHELAVESAVLIVAYQLAEVDTRPTNLIHELDLFGATHTAFQIGQVAVECTIRDDAAKFNPSPFQRPDQQAKLGRKLTALGAKRALSSVIVSLKPVMVNSSLSTEPLYHWYDQILGDMQPGAIFRWNGNRDVYSTTSVWADVVTFWGDGRIDIRRVGLNVLEAALDDIRPGLAKDLLAARPADRSADFLQAGLTRVHAEIRQQVAERLTFDARRYAIRIDTDFDGDRRRWYVVAEIDGDELTVLHRSQLTW